MAPFRIAKLDEVASTNDEVKHAIDRGEPEGLVVRARVQTGGYGRQGRAWASPAGGMYQSLLLRPDVAPEQLPTLALVVALAVRCAALEVSGVPADMIKVKWPNDVLALCDGEFGKLSGISCEAHHGGICVGIGVNVLRPRESATDVPAGKYAPVYMADLAEETLGCESPVDRVGDAVLDELACCYERWIEAGFHPFMQEYSACSFLAGRAVCIADIYGTVAHEGVAEGVDGSGNLLVRKADDILLAVSSGEAHLA